MAKFLKYLGIFAGVVVLILVLIFVALVMFVNPNRFKPVIIQQVNVSTGRELMIDGDLSWTIYPSIGIKVGHASLSNPKGFNQPIFLEISCANVSVSLLPLLDKRIESKGMTLNGLKLNLIKSADGNNNWSFPETKNPTSTSTTKTESMQTAMGIVISALDIDDAQISYTDEAKKQTIEVNHFDLHAKQINLTQPFPITSTFDFNSNQPNIQGSITFNSQIAFNLNKQIFSLRDVDITAKTQQGDKKVSVEIWGDLIADLNEQTLQWSNFKAQMANLNLTGKVNVNHLTTDPQATGHLYAKPFDLKEFLKSLGSENANLQTANNATASIDFDASAKSMNVNGDLKIDDLKAANLSLTNMASKLQYSDGVLNLNPITADLYQGKLNGNVKINLNTPVPFIAIQGTLKDVQSEPLLKDLSEKEQKIKVIGAANVDLNITTSGNGGDEIIKNLNGTSKVSFNNGVLEGVDIGYYIDAAYSLITQQTKGTSTNSDKTSFGNLTATVLIQNGVMTNNDLLLSSPRFDTTGKGVINLVNKTINYSLRAAVKQTNVSTVKSLSGTTIPILISGNLNDPSIRMDTAEILKNIAQAQVEKHKEAIKEKVEEKLKDKIPEQATELLKNLIGH